MLGSKGKTFSQLLTRSIVIEVSSLSFGSTTDTIFIIHQSQQTILAIVKNVLSLDLLSGKGTLNIIKKARAHYL